MDRFSQMALSAARMAEADSGIDDRSEPDRVGAAVATGIGGLGAFEDCFQTLLERGPDRDEPVLDHPDHPEHGRGLGVDGARRRRARSPPRRTACAASNMAIGDGLDAIRLGRAEVMLCGGTEAPITRVGIAGFSAMRALSQRNDDPKRGVAPVRRRPGRVRHGRGGRDARPRGARARARARGEDLRRGARATASRPTRATSPSRIRRARTPRARCGWRSPTRASTPEQVELRQRARHVDAARRPGRDARAQARARRGAGVRGRRSRRRRARPGTASAPPARSRRSSRSSPCSAACCRRRSTTRRPIPTCDLDYIPNEARHAEDRDRRLQLVRLRRPQRCVVFRRWDES